MTCNGEPLWRETGDGHGTTMVATDAGLTAIGIEPLEPHIAPVVTGDGLTEPAAPETAAEAHAAPKGRTQRDGTKQAKPVDMLKLQDGATLEEIMAATGWQAHTVRGAMAGALKKKLELDVTSAKVEGRGRVYRLPTLRRHHPSHGAPPLHPGRRIASPCRPLKQFGIARQDKVARLHVTGPKLAFGRLQNDAGDLGHRLPGFRSAVHLDRQPRARSRGQSQFRHVLHHQLQLLVGDGEPRGLLDITRRQPND